MAVEGLLANLPTDDRVDAVGHIGRDDAGLHQGGYVECYLETLGGYIHELLTAALVTNREAVRMVAQHTEHVGHLKVVGRTVHHIEHILTQAVVFFR